MASSGTEYHRRPIENLLVNGLWDVFVAPVMPALATAAVFSFHLGALFITGLVGFVVSVAAFNRSAMIDDFDMEMNIALGVSTVSIMLLCLLLPTSGSSSLSIFAGLSSAIFGLLSLRINWMPIVGTGAVCGLGAVFGALLFWTQIEEHRRSLTLVLSKSYSDVSALHQKPKEHNKRI